jgi:uncharacterized short protein YbdD (DUF466 family)
MLGRRPGGQTIGRSVARLLPGAVVTLSKAKGRESGWLHRLLSMTRTVVGMPDYEAYLEHFRRFHPDAPILTPRQFYLEFVQARYGDGPTRCC